MLLLADRRTLCRVVVAEIPVSYPGINKCALTLQDPDVHQADSGSGVCVGELELKSVLVDWILQTMHR